jgi:hypothetical protein
MTMTTPTSSRRELAHRASAGIDVYLFWEQRTNRVTVEVIDTRTRDSFELDIDPSDALNVFNHPYAHAALLDTTVLTSQTGDRNHLTRNGRS